MACPCATSPHRPTPRRRRQTAPARHVLLPFKGHLSSCPKATSTRPVPSNGPAARPSPPGPSAQTPSPSPANRAAKRAPGRSQPTASNAESPIKKPHVERARGLSLGPPSPQPPTNDSSRRKRNGHFPGAGASSQRQTCPSLPTGTLRANASPSSAKRAAKKVPERANRPPPTQKAPSRAACGKSARPFLGPPFPQPSTNDSSRRKRNGHAPVCRRIPPKANAPVPPHRDPPRKRLPSPAKRAEKSPRRGPSDHIQRGKSHQKPRAERARGLSLARHPRSHQRTTLRAAKETGIPQSAGASPKRRTRPSLPTGTLRANASRPPRTARQKPPPEGTSRPPPTPARRFPSLRPVFPGTPPRMDMRLGKSGAFRHQTRQLARLTLLSRAESAQPGALGMPANAKIALIYKNQVRFCFPGWRTFSTPVAPLTALPRAPRCRVRG